MSWSRIANDLRSGLFYVVLGVIVGGAVATVQEGAPGRATLNGVVDGGLIATLLVVYLFGMTRWFRGFFRRVPTLIQVVLHPIAQLCLILLGRATGGYLMWQSEFQLISNDPNFVSSVAAALLGLVGAQFAYQASLLIGAGNMLRFVLGRYQKPREETFFVMFLDLASSTSIAESLGNKRFMELLDSLFFDLGRPLLYSKGEIYKYVGDEAIIVWPLRRARHAERILMLPFAFAEVLHERLPFYERRFGLKPQFRAGLHVGRTVVAEIGDVKREIAFMGDTVNTAARLGDHCKSIGAQLVVSKAVTEFLPAPERLTLQSLGPIELKGKSERLELFDVRAR